MLFIVDFPIPDFFDNSINVNPFEVLTSHTRIFILLTSSLEESLQNVDFIKKLGIRFKKCHWMNKCNLWQTLLYKFMLKTTECFYKIARSKYGLNLIAQDARFILPLDTMSKVVYTYTLGEWEYILNMRLWDWTGKAHPDAKIVAQLIYDELRRLGCDIKNYKEIEHHNNYESTFV